MRYKKNLLSWQKEDEDFAKKKRIDIIEIIYLLWVIYISTNRKK